MQTFGGLVLVAWLVTVGVLLRLHEWTGAALIGLVPPALLIGWTDRLCERRRLTRADARDAARAAPPGRQGAAVTSTARTPGPGNA